MHNPAADLLADVVVELRKKMGMNQRELAKALGREQNFVARVETGQRRLDLIEWIQIFRALGVDPEHELSRIAKLVMPLVAKPKKRA